MKTTTHQRVRLWLLTPRDEKWLKITTVASLLVALALVGLVVYQGHIIAQQKEIVDWFEHKFFARPV